MTQFTKAAAVRERTKEPNAGERATVVAALEQAYSLPPAPVDWFTRAKFDEALRGLDFTSTPGIPYMMEAPTIGQWLRAKPDGTYDQTQAERLWYDVNRLYQGSKEHVFRVFVKDEPHKKQKIEQKRWRLIVCASLSMQMLWRMALKHQNDYLNNNPYDLPSAHGLVFCYGGWRRFKQHVKSSGLRYSRDISSWDVFAPGWIFRCIREWRQRAGGPADWLRVLDYLYDDAFVSPVLKFSNGMVVEQMYEGTMKSGLFVTISDNSAAQYGMHILACIRSGQIFGSMWATGDDVLQSHISDKYLDELESLGCVVKEFEQRLMFMGTDFEEEPEPAYLEKHLVNSWIAESDHAERIDSYLRLYAYSPWWWFWKYLAESRGLTTRSQAFYQFWYGSPLAKILTWM